MICKKCGNELNESDLFCDFCGEPVLEIKTIKKKRNMINLKRIIVISVLSFILIIGGIFIFMRKGPSIEGTWKVCSYNDSNDMSLLQNNYQAQIDVESSRIKALITYVGIEEVEEDRQNYLLDISAVGDVLTINFDLLSDYPMIGTRVSNGKGNYDFEGTWKVQIDDEEIYINILNEGDAWYFNLYDNSRIGEIILEVKGDYLDIVCQSPNMERKLTLIKI